MRLARDRAKGHGACGKALDDVSCRFHLIQRDGLATIFRRILDPEQAAHGQQPFGLVVQQVRIGPIFVLRIATHGMLKQRDRLRGPGMRLAAGAIGIFAAHIQGFAIDRRITEGIRMTQHGFF